jgi:hypothetical protein
MDPLFCGTVLAISETGTLRDPTELWQRMKPPSIATEGASCS